MRALIIDDSNTMRSVLKMHLKRAGFETLEAGSAEAGWDVLQLEGAPAVAGRSRVSPVPRHSLRAIPGGWTVACWSTPTCRG